MSSILNYTKWCMLVLDLILDPKPIVESIEVLETLPAKNQSITNDSVGFITISIILVAIVIVVTLKIMKKELDNASKV